MGSRVFHKDSTDYYENICKMMSQFSMPHEGDPAISLEMVDNLAKESRDMSYYENMFMMVSYGLMAQEGGIAAYEQLVRES